MVIANLNKAVEEIKKIFPFDDTADIEILEDLRSPIAKITVSQDLDGDTRIKITKKVKRV